MQRRASYDDKTTPIDEHLKASVRMDVLSNKLVIRHETPLQAETYELPQNSVLEVFRFEGVDHDVIQCTFPGATFDGHPKGCGPFVLNRESEEQVTSFIRKCNRLVFTGVTGTYKVVNM